MVGFVDSIPELSGMCSEDVFGVGPRVVGHLASEVALGWELIR